VRGPLSLPCLRFAQRGVGDGYGVRHHLDEVSIAPLVEVAEEAVASVVLPADQVYGVHGRRLEGRIAVSEHAILAVNRKAQRPLRVPVVRRPPLDHAYFPPTEAEILRPLLRSVPYLAIHPLQERLASLA
jgi:hypothetical protein